MGVSGEFGGVFIYYKWVRCWEGEWGRGLYFDRWKVDNHVLGCDGILSKGDCFSGESTEIKKILKIRGGASAITRLRGFADQREEGGVV